MVYTAVLATWMVMGSNPELHLCLWTYELQVCELKSSAAMLASIQSAGVTPEVNLGTTQVSRHAWDPFWL